MRKRMVEIDKVMPLGTIQGMAVVIAGGNTVRAAPSKRASMAMSSSLSIKSVGKTLAQARFSSLLKVMSRTISPPRGTTTFTA